MQIAELTAKEVIEYICHFSLKDDDERCTKAYRMLMEVFGLKIRPVLIDRAWWVIASAMLPELPPVTEELRVLVHGQELSSEQILKVESWVKSKDQPCK